VPGKTVPPPWPSPAWRLVERLSGLAAGVTVRAARPHGQYGTVEVELELDDLPPPAGTATAAPTRLLLDVASARGETYPVPADNPVVRFGALEDDLARRDLSINAMAMELATGTLLDPHGGQRDLANRSLRFLQAHSLRDDPTRLVRAARYAARLGFALAPESQSQAASTLAAWPWAWHPGDPPSQAPAALGTRLRREFELLLEQDTWPSALDHLRRWGGLLLLDPALQADRRWDRRLRWARRLHVPPLVALVAVARDPLALAERLQLPHRHHKLLAQFLALRRQLAEPPDPDSYPEPEPDSNPGPDPDPDPDPSPSPSPSPDLDPVPTPNPTHPKPKPKRQASDDQTPQGRTPARTPEGLTPLGRTPQGRAPQGQNRTLGCSTSATPNGLAPWHWCQRLETPGLSPAAVALALACGVGPRRPLLRWLLRWRHLGPARTAQDLMADGVPPGPELGERLRQSRRERLERERF
jgi:hypothetical protein